MPGSGGAFRGLLSEPSAEVVCQAGGGQVGSGAVGLTQGRESGWRNSPPPAPSGVGPGRRPQTDRNPRQIEAS